MSTLDDGLRLKEKRGIAIVDLSLPEPLCNWKYAELDDEIQRLCADLTAFGAKAEDVIAFPLINSIEYVITFLAIGRLGAIAAPLNFAYKDTEFQFYLEDSKASFLIVSETGNAAAEATAKGLNLKILEFVLNREAKKFSLRAKDKELSRSMHTVTPQHRAAPDVTCLILHTSGTTSRPKAVPLSQNNLVTSLRNIRNTYKFTESDVSLLVMPLFHIHGMVCGLLSSLSVGAKIVIPSGGAFSASHFWTDAVEHKITWFTAVPTILHVLLLRASTDYPATHPPPLRFIRSCSSALPANVMRSLERTFNVPVLEAYAMTEASHQVASSPLDGERRPGTVGLPQNVAVAILDQHGRELGPGETGEVCIRGDNVTKGYLNNATANKEAFMYGWFHTGDLGHRDADGYLTLAGRIKELINRGGEKISPAELDGFLLRHPAVAEAVAFGGPDEKYGEAVYCAVTLKPGTSLTEEELLEYCRSNIAKFKVPSRAFIAETLPKTATGKIQRRHVASHFLQM